MKSNKAAPVADSARVAIVGRGEEFAGPIRRINPLTDTIWESAIGKFPQATFFHSTRWAQVLRDTYGMDPIYLLAGSIEAPQAALPLVEANSWVTGRRGISLPFSDECECLGDDKDATTATTRSALTLGDGRWRWLEFRGRGSVLPDFTPSVSFFGHTIDLRATPETFLARMESATRRSIRKAEQSGVTVEVSQSLEATEEFHRLLGLTRQKHGMPLQPFRFFRSLHRHVLEQGQGCIVLARQGTKAIAGAMYFHFRDIALFKFGASDHRLQHLRANNLVMWEAIQWHARRGFVEMDLGRTSLGNEGLRRFKLGWGTRERSIDYARFDYRTRGWTISPDRSAGWHASVFRYMPRSLSRLIGAVIYRHIA